MPRHGPVETGYEKVREARLRRVTGRRGLRLTRSRRRDPRALTYGRYFVQAQDGSVPNGYATVRGFTLDEIEERLNTGPGWSGATDPFGSGADQVLEVAIREGKLRVERDRLDIDGMGRVSAYLNGEPITKERAEELLTRNGSA